LTIDQIVILRRAEHIPQMRDFFLAQMDDFFTEGLCFDNCREGEGERRFGALPFCDVSCRGSLAVSGRGRSKGRSQVD
jgi:hypothetical protein